LFFNAFKRNTAKTTAPKKPPQEVEVLRKTTQLQLNKKFGAADRTRTYDRLVNSQPLYLAELRRHNMALIKLSVH
jgi:hypothetical protein